MAMRFGWPAPQQHGDIVTLPRQLVSEFHGMPLGARESNGKHGDEDFHEFGCVAGCG
jgi:hypothetical protein